jgi:hypothetical protein
VFGRQSQPGYIETALHQAPTPDADFLFVSIARWETPEELRAAIGSVGMRAAAGLAGYRPHPGLYRAVRT